MFDCQKKKKNVILFYVQRHTPRQRFPHLPAASLVCKCYSRALVARAHIAAATGGQQGAVNKYIIFLVCFLAVMYYIKKYYIFVQLNIMCFKGSATQHILMLK